MFRIDGINGESIVIDGVWVEKLRANTSTGRKPADRYAGTDVKEFSRRKRLFGGGREDLLQLTVNLGAFVSLVVTGRETGRGRCAAGRARRRPAARHGVVATPVFARRILPRSAVTWGRRPG